MPGDPGTAGFSQYAEAYMNNLNSVLLEGNMVRDPLIRSTSRGTNVCNFTIASNRFYRQDSNLEKEVGFFDVEAWGKLAVECSSLGRKGRGVRVVGRLKQDRWTGNDGKNHTRVAIVAEHMEYRPDLKKTSETASETAAMVAEVAGAGDHVMSRGQYAYSGSIMEEARIEEMETISF